jgi:hypothetical protein
MDCFAHFKQIVSQTRPSQIEEIYVTKQERAIVATGNVENWGCRDRVVQVHGLQEQADNGRCVSP